MDLVIGIEFIKMLIKHTPGSVVEVLLFALSRHMVLEGKDGQAQAMEALAYGLATGKPLQNLSLPGEIRLEDNKYIRLPYKKVDQKAAEEILSK